MSCLDEIWDLREPQIRHLLAKTELCLAIDSARHEFCHGSVEDVAISGYKD